MELLTDAQARRCMAEVGTMSQTALAVKYGVSHSTVRRLIKGETAQSQRLGFPTPGLTARAEEYSKPRKLTPKEARHIRSLAWSRSAHSVAVEYQIKAFTVLNIWRNRHYLDV